MPAFIRKIDGKFRVVHRTDSGVQLVKRAGSAVDGGGHTSSIDATKQARTINSKKHKQ
jgi:hypothetical protein